MLMALELAMVGPQAAAVAAEVAAAEELAFEGLTGGGGISGGGAPLALGGAKATAARVAVPSRNSASLSLFLPIL